MKIALLTILAIISVLSGKIQAAEKAEKSAEVSPTVKTLGWRDGIEDLQGTEFNKVTRPIFKGKTVLTSGVGARSNGQSIFSGGIAHQLSPELSVFSSTTSGWTDQPGRGQTSLGLAYTGYHLGEWSLGITGSFSPGADSLGLQNSDSSSRANQLLSGDNGYSLGASLGRSWGDFSTILSIQMNRNQNWQAPGLGVSQPWQESFWRQEKKSTWP